MIQEGDDQDILSISGNYGGGTDLWGWRTTFVMPTKNELIISHYNKPPREDEYLGVESKLKRVK